MLRRGIDISSWQTGLDLDALKRDIDFCIVKATEGVGLVDSRCDKFVSECKRLGYDWGFYHFARNNSPEADAEFFYKNTKNYFGEGIPILDLEDTKIADWGDYAQRFCDRIHALSGVYPMIYTSAAFRNQFAKTTLPQKCALWLAGYPRKYTNWDQVKDPETIPYGIYPWESCAIWQFSGNGKVRGFSGDVDLDFCYITRDQWKALAKGDAPEPAARYTDAEIVAAAQVIAGEWGTGGERKAKLEKAGFDYSKVQGAVNEMLAAVR